ncbi:unnamed protein product [Linum tenue]|uniref:Threonylcarbamoyl-AMP synthase n=1 Tax=Linum tenue TaxID=586396 RepID=A0AAV0NGX3_9ROSI|nr:unnamed protein product [Linum tenue]
MADSKTVRLGSRIHTLDLAAPRMPRPFQFPSRVSFPAPAKPPLRFRVLAMAVKRSPKRLKYSAPRFTKVHDSSSFRYAIVCDLKSPSAIERLRRIKHIEPSKPLSILCRSLRDIDMYTTGFPRGDGQGHASIFRAVKHCLPGPYTFILTASKELPKRCMRYGTPTAKYAARKDVGVRMPDDAICRAILEKLDAPLISTSVKGLKENEWLLDPVAIADAYGPEGLDFIIDGGVRVADPSTVVDMTRITPVVVRQGKGPKLPWMESEEDSESALKPEDLIPYTT